MTRMPNTPSRPSTSICRTSPAWSPRWAGLPRSRSPTSVDALVRRDTELAQRVDRARPDDRRACSARSRRSAILTIARRQPMAVDLREIVGALRVANDLERIGDLAKNIAKRVIALGTATFRAAR